MQSRRIPHVLLVQLPVPQLNFGRETGNIPFGAACLYQAAANATDARITLLSQETATYAGDAALLDHILSAKPDIIGFTVYLWNIRRTLYLCCQIKKRYAPRIVLGGPEITPDNEVIQTDAVDFYVYGEGEAIFSRLIQEPALWQEKAAAGTYGHGFSKAPSPYLAAPLSLDLERIMLLETMRGCPYKCAFCFYNKSHEKMMFKEAQLVLDGLAWARKNKMKEVYFLDPSLNSRPGLASLLDRMADINKDHALSLISEIRAEAVDRDMARRLAAAGFTWMEVGLQSITPAALKAMNRKVDLDRFVAGTHALMSESMTPAVDLIVGLPGDDPAGFEKTVDFVMAHGLHGDIQVFPLSLIPGTEFRRRHAEYGLVFEPDPPYTVLSTPTFSREDMLAAFDLAEEKLDISLYPYPDLDAAYKKDIAADIVSAPDVAVTLEGRALLYKVVLQKNRLKEELAAAARRVAHPYQLLVPPNTSFNAACQTLSLFTAANPYTPMEVIFFNPAKMPDVEKLLRWDRLARPGYLDNDLRLLFPEAGNRTLQVTVVSEKSKAPLDSVPMLRHIFWWRKNTLPSEKHIKRMEENGYDGILIDPPEISSAISRWMADMAGFSQEAILIDFALTALHRQWLEKTCSEDYCADLLPL